jgi:hypothetical protein
MNENEYYNAREANTTKYAKQRHGAPLSYEERSNFIVPDSNGVSRQYQPTDENLNRVLAAYGISVTSANELVRLHRDPYQAELDVIAHVCAYFDISSRRLIDEIPQNFETVFAGDFAKTLQSQLTTKLNLVGDRGLENCARYIRDEPDVQAKRDNLTRMSGILENARSTIDRFFK